MTPAEDGVIGHVRRFFDGQDVSLMFESGGPVLKRVPNFRVLRVAPGPRLPGIWAYVTVGCWDAVHTEAGHGTEFVMTAAQPDERHALHLAMTAYYHAGPIEQRLDVGHTVPIGEGWIDGSHLDHFLVSVPYPFGPELEQCRWDGGHARLLWLLPITEAEKDFKVTNGLEALEERFESQSIRYWEPDRPSVA